MYLLDTCVVSDFIKGHRNTLNKVKSINPHHLFLSTISLMEIEYGLQKNPQKAYTIQTIIMDFLSTIRILDFRDQEAKCAGNIRSDLNSKGTPIGPYDILIAATAVHNKLTLVTSNVNEFKRVENLLWENWRD